MLAESVYLLRHSLPSSIRLSCSPCQPPLWIRADPVHVEQILLNLAINARDAMPNGGMLEISLAAAEAAAADRLLVNSKPEAGVARLMVRDTGVGIPAEVRSRVFDPYFTTKPRGQGSGLGLSIVHGIVRDLGGRIDLESQVGQGTTVTMSIALHQATGVDLRASEGGAGVSTGKRSGRSARRRQSA